VSLTRVAEGVEHRRPPTALPGRFSSAAPLKPGTTGMSCRRCCGTGFSP
jgi:hypothetical protein